MRRLLLGAIAFYQRRISPLFGPRCRFQPSCSAYAREAVETHGACKGLLLSIGRILRCNPLTAKPGQYNPVPPRGRWRHQERDA